MQNDRVYIVVEHIKKDDSSISSVIMDNYNTNSSFQGGDYADSAISIPHTISYDGGVYTGYLSTTSSSDIEYSDDGYSCSWQMTIYGSDINNFIIIFDKELNEFAVDIEINGVLYKNDSTEFVYHTDIKYDSITVKFLSFNKPNTLIKFWSLLVGLSSVYDKTNGLVSFYVENKDKNDAMPEYGIMSQSGSITLMDKYGRLSNLSKLGLLSDSAVDIYIGDFKLGKFSTKSEWSYNNNNKQYSVELDDGLTKLQSIKQKEIINLSNATALDLYYRIVSMTPAEFEGIDDFTKMHLLNIKIENCFKQNDYIWNIWQEFCIGTSTIMSINNYGKVQVRR